MLNKSKLLFAFMPFMLASCGGKAECLIRREGTVRDYKCSDSSQPSYFVVNYSLTFIDKNSKKVTKNDFTANINGKSVTATCLVHTTNQGTPSTGTYDTVLSDVTVTENETQVYAAWSKDSGLTANADFYCKGNKITTKSQIFKI